MQTRPVYGPSLPEWGWVPAPSYLMRRQLILDRLASEAKSELLEIGPEPAVLLYELANQGWACTGPESSESALKIARAQHATEHGAEIFSRPRNDWTQRFDWIMAMEVLEHIEDDRGALNDWRDWLKPGGILLLSVPAHQNKWSHSDVWAGHYRRYEREGLSKLVADCGFAVHSVLSYGFPVSNLIEPIRSWHHGRLLKHRFVRCAGEMQKNTAESGVSRDLEARLYPLYANFVGTALMQLAFRIQPRFIHGDRGTGYLLEARRTK